MAKDTFTKEPELPAEVVIAAGLDAAREKAAELGVDFDEIIVVTYSAKRGVEMGGTTDGEAYADVPSEEAMRLLQEQFTLTLLLCVSRNARILGMPIAIAPMPPMRGQG